MIRRPFLALPLAIVIAVMAACTATPLPDPPSFDAARMSITATDPMTIQLTGEDGAIGTGNIELRITNPTTAASVEVPVTDGGAFDGSLPGTAADTLFLEQVDGDLFIGAVKSDGAGAVEETDEGPDTDGDGSPDAVDCAPNDPDTRGSACGAGCSNDADCATGQVCVSGVCEVD
ncbi:MAG: hypothetical protein HOW73_13950 [Polyangiaceae bacterium]|nr:hypothetical protein [Polyangiaceae bacterium]